MTVSQLIEILLRAPQDLEVYTEGCDCTGEIGKAVIDDMRIMLCRPDGETSWVSDEPL